MRALLERSRPARAAVALLAVACVLVLVRGAEAGGDLGLRRDTFWPEFQPVLQAFDLPGAAAPAASAPPTTRHRRARRIWAASRSRPLRIRLARRSPRGPSRAPARIAAPGPRRTTVAAARPARATGSAARSAAEPQVVFPALIVLPKPPRPALVSIYQDRTLRDGDAVMMQDGIHVFRGRGDWPFKPRDFPRLTFVAALDWHLRQTLDALDRNPPTRWSSTGSTSG